MVELDLRDLALAHRRGGIAISTVDAIAIAGAASAGRISRYSPAASCAKETPNKTPPTQLATTASSSAMHVPSRTTEKVSRDRFRSQKCDRAQGELVEPVHGHSATSVARSSITYAALRCRAVGTCFCQHTTVQKRNFRRPVLHDATVHRTAEVPIGINLRHVAQTKLAMSTS
jgi:hypothetical protein